MADANFYNDFFDKLFNEGEDEGDCTALAETTFEIFTAFKKAGFTSEQALYIVCEMITSAIGGNL